MFSQNVFRSRVLVFGLSVAFILLVTPVMDFAQAPAPGASLVGFVYGKDATTPVPSAVIKIRDVGKGKEFASPPADENGMYKISGIPEGRYILGVTSPEGDFNFDYVMHVKANEMAKLSVALTPGGQTTGGDAEKKSFFKSPLGIALMLAVVVGGLFLILGKEEAASPIR